MSSYLTAVKVYLTSSGILLCLALILTQRTFDFVVLMQSATRVGISVAGVLNYKLEPVASAHTCADITSCGPTFQTCVEVYNSRPNTYVEIYAWYQTRSVKWCRGRLPWGGSFVSGICIVVYLLVCVYVCHASEHAQ